MKIDMPAEVFEACLAESPSLRKWIMDKIQHNMTKTQQVLESVIAIIRSNNGNKIMAIREVINFSKRNPDEFGVAFPEAEMIHTPDGFCCGLGSAKKIVERFWY